MYSRYVFIHMLGSCVCMHKQKHAQCDQQYSIKLLYRTSICQTGQMFWHELGIHFCTAHKVKGTYVGLVKLFGARRTLSAAIFD